MDARPRLQTTGLPTLSEDAAMDTTSPARGKEMRTNLLQKLRPPPLVHAWDFWFEKPSITQTGEPSPQLSQTNTTEVATNSTHGSSIYAPNLFHLHSISDVRAFWSLFNNFDLNALPVRHTVHLFHKSTLPVWEHPRNFRGGSWTFRVPRATASSFFNEMCLLAISEQLQEAVTTDRVTFRDDICGVSFSMRMNGALVSVWNRDAEHEAGVKGIERVVRDAMPKDLMVGEGQCYYKRHSEHDGFDKAKVEEMKEEESRKVQESNGTGDKGAEGGLSNEKMDEQLAQVKKIMEDAKAGEDSGISG